MLYRVIISPRQQHLSHVIKEPLETLCWKTSSLRGGERCRKACSKPSDSSAPFLENLGEQSRVAGQGDPGGMPSWAVSSDCGFSAHHPAPGLATTLRVTLGDAIWVQSPRRGQGQLLLPLLTTAKETCSGQPAKSSRFRPSPFSSPGFLMLR